MKLTANTVRTAALPADKSEAIHFDDDIPGFGLRLRAQGSRSFVFQYKVGAKQRRMALGTATAADARKTASTLYARVRLGQDPAADKVETRRQVAETFKAGVDEYLRALRKRYRPRSYTEIERHLLKHAKALHELQLAKIGRRDVASIIVAVTNAAGAPTANRVRSSVSTFFSWAMARGLVENNPVIGTEKNEEKSRERVLTPAELRLIWNALGDYQYGACIKLLALTGQRLAEIGRLRWSEIHGSEIILPADQECSSPCPAVVRGRRRHHRAPAEGDHRYGFRQWQRAGIFQLVRCQDQAR